MSTDAYVLPAFRQGLGGGSIGVARAAHAAADGYTISLGNFSSHVLAAIQTGAYDVLNDFEPVVLLASNPQMIVSRNTIPAQDLKGLMAWLQANGGKVSAGTAGVGSVSHFAGELFQKETGTHFQLVPYRGVNLAQQDLIAITLGARINPATGTMSRRKTKLSLSDGALTAIPGEIRRRV